MQSERCGGGSGVPDERLADGAVRARNVFSVLHALMSVASLAEALLNEFAGHPIRHVAALEVACLRHLDGAPPVDPHAPAPDAGTLAQERHERTRSTRVRIAITQGNQAVWGKLKQRLWDFRERAECGRPGAWEAVGM